MRLLPVVRTTGGNRRYATVKTVYYTPVDEEYFDYFSQFLRWLDNGHGYVVRYEGGKMIYLHREVARLARFPPSEEIDHIDRNPRNNVRANLKPSTRSENRANKGLDQDSTSGYKGVSWRKNRQKWQVFIKVRGRRIYLGLFEFAALAALAYDDAAKKHFGSYACTNQDLGLVLRTEDL